MPKGKSKSKGKKLSKTKKSSKYRIPVPENVKVDKKEGFMIIDYEQPFLTGRMRQSFDKLKLEDKKREYGASYDFKGSKFENIDISRGKTGKETTDGRASVKVRIDDHDESAVHSHPFKDKVKDIRTNRPSGKDIHVLIFQKDRGYNIKSKFISSPTGHYVKYEVEDMDKAREFSLQAKREKIELFEDEPSGSKRNAIDWKLEKVYNDMYKKNLREIEEENVVNPKHTVIYAKTQARQKEIKRRYGILLKKANTEQRRRELIRERSIRIIEEDTKALNNLEKYPAYIPNKKYRKFKTPQELNRQVYVARRTNREWGRYVRKNVGVRITWIKKPYTQDISI